MRSPIKKLFILLLALCMSLVASGTSFLPVYAEGEQILPMISIGSNHFAIALKADGTLWSWGNNHAGQLGNGTKSNRTDAAAVTMPQGDVKFCSVSAGYDHALALDSNGEVWAWGSNASGQLGISTEDFSEFLVPTKINMPDGVRFCAIAAGSAYSLALSTDRQIWAWGSNEYLLLGVSKETVPSFSDEPIRSELLHEGGRTFQSIFASDFSAGALTVSNELFFWGVNSDYRFGLDTMSSPLLPTNREYRTTDFVLTGIAFGAYHTTILDAEGTLRTFGRNQYGQFGDGTRNESSMSMSTNKKADLQGVASVASGAYHVLALTTNGTVYSYGNNQSGQLGFENAMPEKQYCETPTALTIGEGVITAIAANGSTSAAIDADGYVWMWGDGAKGELGNGTATSNPTPTPAKVRCGSGFLCLGLPPRDIVQNSYITATASVPAPTYTVTIPAGVEFGELKQKKPGADDCYQSVSFDISVSGVDNLFGELQIAVKVTGENGRFELVDGDHRLLYDVFSASNAEVPLACDDTLAVFTEDGSASGALRIDQSQITRSGDYHGTLIFTVVIEELVSSTNQ